MPLVKTELELSVHVSKNRTVIEMNLGLHPADVSLLENDIINFLKEGASKTKHHIFMFNRDLT